MYIIKLSVLSNTLLSACTAEPAPAEDYPKLYGTCRSQTIRHRLDLDFMLLRLQLVNESKRQEVEDCLQHADAGFGVARCMYCRTIDWERHDDRCPIHTPEGSPEREANTQGESDGRQGKSAADPENPVYMLGYAWGASCKQYWDGHREE